MKPFGHTDVREGRDADISPLDEEMDAVWTRYCARQYYDFDMGPFEFARALLAGIPLSTSLLERHIIRTSISHPDDTPQSLGFFVSAGYQLLPEQRIVYPLNTPWLYFLGHGLFMKELVITGSVGPYAGSSMVGTLVNQGELGIKGGVDMIGHLRNEGKAGDLLGHRMAGTLINTGEAQEVGVAMIGYQENLNSPLQGRTQSWTLKSSMERLLFRKEPLGRTKKRFLRDIENSNRISHYALWDKIREDYT
jgi:hypothetical protein